MEVIPRDDYVVIIPEEVKEKTKSGILIPTDSNTEQLGARGTIYKVGPNVTNLSPKQEVIYKRHMVEEVSVEDEIYLFTQQENIFAILHD